MRLKLSEHTLKVVYKKGEANKIEEDVSRLPTKGETKVVTDEEIPCYFAGDPGKEKEVVTGSNYD